MNTEHKEVFTNTEKTTIKAQLKVAVVILVITSIIGLITSYTSKKPITNKPNTIQDQSLGVVKIEDKTAPYIDIVAEYPTEGTGSLFVEKNVQDIIKAFKNQNDFSKFAPQELKNFGISDERRYQLYITYSSTSGAHTISHRITTYTFTGGAHGNTFVETYTYTANEKLLSINDLFVDSEKGLELISKKTIESIKNNPDYKDGLPTDWFDDGTAPTLQNYSTFELTKDSLVIIFQQYQALAYVYGNIEVRIPLKELSNVLKPEFK